MSKVFSIVLAIVSILMLGVVVVSSGSNQDPPPNTPSIPIYLPLVYYSPSGSKLAAPGTATDLDAQVNCEEPGRSIANLSWKIAEDVGNAQRVDVTIYSFEEGEFESSKPLPPDQSSLTWTQLKGQAIHFWKVFTLHENAWVPSEIGSFEGPTCVGDSSEPPISPPQ